MPPMAPCQRRVTLDFANCAVVAMSLGIACVATPAGAGEPDYRAAFAGLDACFEVYDLKASRFVVVHNPKQCAARTSPMSTFKVPLALMAFDRGVLIDESTQFKWDGKQSIRAAWNA